MNKEEQLKEFQGLIINLKYLIYKRLPQYIIDEDERMIALSTEILRVLNEN